MNEWMSPFGHTVCWKHLSMNIHMHCTHVWKVQYTKMIMLIHRWMHHSWRNRWMNTGEWWCYLYINVTLWDQMNDRHTNWVNYHWQSFWDVGLQMYIPLSISKTHGVFSRIFFSNAPILFSKTFATLTYLLVVCITNSSFVIWQFSMSANAKVSAAKLPLCPHQHQVFNNPKKPHAFEMTNCIFPCLVPIADNVQFCMVSSHTQFTRGVVQPTSKHWRNIPELQGKAQAAMHNEEQK